MFQEQPKVVATPVCQGLRDQESTTALRNPPSASELNTTQPPYNPALGHHVRASDDYCFWRHKTTGSVYCPLPEHAPGAVFEALPHTPQPRQQNPSRAQVPTDERTAHTWATKTWTVAFRYNQSLWDPEDTIDVPLRMQHKPVRFCFVGAIQSTSVQEENKDYCSVAPGSVSVFGPKIKKSRQMTTIRTSMQRILRPGGQDVCCQIWNNLV